MIKLRPYQQNAVNTVINHLRGAPYSHPVLMAPTASGKSVIQAALIKRAIENAATPPRFLCLTHVKELIEQNAEKMHDVFPEGDIGINSASLGLRQRKNQILFAGIQSIYQKPDRIGRFDAIMIDEAHLVPVKTSTGMYRTFLNAQMKINPHVNVLGWTATPYRLDNGLLTAGDNRLFTDLLEADGMSIPELIAEGYLSPLSTPGDIQTTVDLDGIPKVGSDYNKKALSGRMNTKEINQMIVQDTIDHGRMRRSWLTFAVGVKHARALRDEFIRQGVTSTEIITGDTHKKVRAMLIKDFREGRLRNLINVDVLTTGFDAPGVDLICAVRPTKSTSLYVQMMGRGMRIASSKYDCLVLDYAGLLAEHGPVDTACQPPKFEAPEKKTKAQLEEENLKECPECFALLHISTRMCNQCDHIFSDIKTRAATKQILSDGGAVTFKVTSVSYDPHAKPGKPLSVRATYWENNRIIAREWLCFWHDGYAQQKAELWWKKNVGTDIAIPDNVHEAIRLINLYAIEPAKILVSKRGNFADIKAKFYPKPVKD